MPKRKKKHSRFFELYISKILQQVSPENGIDSNAKQQLNTAICILCKQISDQALALAEFAHKKTISIKEVQNSLKLLVSGELLENSMGEGQRAITKYEEYNQTKLTLATKLPSCSRNNKAGIIFPPSVLEKFLRRFNYSKIMVTASAPVYLAAAVEYITAEILSISSLKTNAAQKIRITIRHIELAIREDTEFNQLFNKLKIRFLGGGFLPGIHKEFMMKKKKGKKGKKNEKVKEEKVKEEKVNEDEKIIKIRRYRPGTIALKEIKKYQKNGNLMLARTPFERLVRSGFTKYEEVGEKYKISKKVFIILQYYVEQNVIQALRMANLISIHSKHTKLTEKDILLSNFISQGQYNFSIEQYEEAIGVEQYKVLKRKNLVKDKNDADSKSARKSSNEDEDLTEVESISLDPEDLSSEEEIPTEDSSEEDEYITETDFFTETETPWAGPRYLKSRARMPTKA